MEKDDVTEVDIPRDGDEEKENKGLAEQQQEQTALLIEDQISQLKLGSDDGRELAEKESDETQISYNLAKEGEEEVVVQLLEEGAAEIVQIPGLNLKEWTTMEHLLAKIPLKAQKGLTTFDLELTCVDAVDDYLVLGTNVGLIYWYRRSTDFLERLKIEGSTSPITNIRVISSIDYIIAAGTKAGIISIFQIPKVAKIDDGSHGSSSSSSSSGADNDHGLGGTRRTAVSPGGGAHDNKKKVQIFTVKDMHKSKITALEWSTNGMKLFSGDFNGLVIYTEMDYCSGVSKSVQLWNETCEIVQLSYAHKILVISSIYQTLLFKTESNACHRIGSQERKILGHFGAVFESGLWNKNLKLYVVRPGLRIWIADFDGVIRSTIVLKDWYFNRSSEEQELEGTVSEKAPSEPENQSQQLQQQQSPPLQFGLIYNFLGKYLLTITSSYLFVIDPLNIQILTSFPINILSIGVHGNEIFILTTARHLIRLSTAPDLHLSTLPSNSNGNNFIPEQWPDTFNFLSKKFKKTTQALQKSTIINTFKNVIQETNDYLLQDSSRTATMSLSGFGMMSPHFFETPEIHISSSEQNANSYHTKPGGSSSASTLDAAAAASYYLDYQKIAAKVEKFDKISQEDFQEIVVAQFKPESGSGSVKRKSKPRKLKSKDSGGGGGVETIHSASASGTNTPNTLMSDSVSMYSTNSSATNNSEGNGASEAIMIINNNNNTGGGDSCSGSPFTDESTNSNNNYTSSSSKQLTSPTCQTDPDFDPTATQPSQDQYLSHIMSRNAGIPALEEVKYYNHQQLLQTNLSDLESKELMLAKLLNWSELLPENIRLEEELNQAKSKVDQNLISQTACEDDGDAGEVRVPVASSSTSSALGGAATALSPEIGIYGSFELSTGCSSESTLKEDFPHNPNTASHNNSLDESSLDIYTKYGDYHNHHVSSITSNMSFGPPSGSSNIMMGGRRRCGGGGGGATQSDIYIDEDDDDGQINSRDSYCSAEDNNVLDLQLDQLVGASCGGKSAGGGGGGGGQSASGRSSCSLVIGNSLLASQDMKVEGVIGNDDWIQYNLPSSVASLATSDSYVVCIDTKWRVYYSPFYPNGSNNLCWIKTDYQANHLAVSANGEVVWRLLNGTLYSLTFPSKAGPFTIEGEWITIGNGVKSISVDNEVGWMVKSNGSVHMCLRIKDGKPIPSQIFEPIPCAHSIDEITILGTNVWARTDGGKLLYRNKISVVNVQGSEWIQFKFTTPLPSTPSISIVSISLGPGDALWFMDSQFNLYFINGITYDTPGGNGDSVWRVSVANCRLNKDVDPKCPSYTFSSTSSLLPTPPSPTLPSSSNWKTRLVETLKNPLSSFIPSKQSPILTAKYSSIWFTQFGSSEVYANRTIVTGHRWEPVQMSPSTKVWKWWNVYGNGINEKYGLLWLLDPKKRLYYMTNKKRIEGLEISSVLINGTDVGTIAHVAPAPEALWVLTTNGHIFGRCNMNCRNDIGQSWGEIPLVPLENVSISHVSCGSDVAWACDTKGKIYIRIGSLNPPESVTDMCTPWIKVDGGPISSHGSIFTKVYVGANGHMVWALDSQNNVYTRVAIFPDVPIGTEWVLVSGIEAESLAISDSFVWALSPKGEIFCRFGLTKSNFIGDYWRKIPGQVKNLTVSVCNKVWALDLNCNLINHVEQTVNFPIASELNLLTPSPDLTPVPTAESEDCGEWEFLG